MRTAEPIGEICGHEDNDMGIESKAKGRRGRAVRRVASVAMAGAVGLGVTVGLGTSESVERAGFGSSPGRGVVADIRGGMNLGNHNETLLVPRPAPRRTGTRAAAEREGE